MADYATRIAALSLEKRELLIQRLKEKQNGVTRSSSALPQIVPNPKERYLGFPLTDIQRAYWIGRSDLFDLGTCANVYLEDEIIYQLPQGKLAWNWQALLGWLSCTLGRKYLENRIATFFVDRLNAALQRLIERHDMLRAIFSPNGQQKVLPHVPAYRAQVLDLRRRPTHQVEAALEPIRERLRYTKAPVEQWPLFEFLVCLLDDRRIRFLVRIDPLIIDGESRTNFITELGQLLLEPQFPLLPLECTYRDYALTWAAFQESELFQRSRDYWQNRLPTMPTAPELPMIQNIGPLTPSRFKFLNVELLQSQPWQRLKARAARIGISPSGIALAAFVEILATWSLEPSFTIGLIGTYHPPIHPQIQDVFGNFNSLALLTVENWPGTFEERAKRLWEQLITDLEHRYFSGHQILEEWRRKIGGSSKAIVPIYFNSVLENSQPDSLSYQYIEEREMEADTTDWYQLRSIEIGAYFPQILLMSVLQEDGNGTLSSKWQIAEAVFPPGMIEDMVAAYHRFLHRLADDDSSWDEVTRQLLPPEQLTQRITFNDSEAPLPQTTLHTLFATRVSQQPSQVALVVGSHNLTYRAVYRRANQIGRRLRELGVRPNDLVAIVTESGWEQVIAVLGVLISGAAYLPLDPHLAQDCLARLVAHSEVKWILTQSWLDKNLEWPENVLRLVVDDNDEWADVADHPLDPMQTLEDLACVMYTSVSSEHPKGVMLSHRGLLNTLLDVNHRWNVGSQDRILALSPLSCDLSLYDILGILAAGGTIVMPQAQTGQTPATLIETIQCQQITIWNSFPALLETLLAHIVEYSKSLSRSLRLVLSSRDRMSATLFDRLQFLNKDAQIVAFWGVPEAAVWSSFHVVQDTDALSRGSFNGQPLANQRLYVLDPWLEPRPIWVPGRLYIGGAGLAQGYWGDKDNTQASFIHHPYSGERLYRTEEFGRFLPDGTIEFLGPEKDSQVTVHGYRVEPRQIEATLEQHAAVQQCVVVTQKNTRHHSQLTAYIVFHPGQMLTIEALPEFIETKLLSYMMPAAFVALDSMPLTCDGRLDRDALSSSADNNSEPQAVKIAPRNALEIRLAQIWQTLLGNQTIGVTDNFFDLGGNSFLVVCLINRVREEFEIEQPFHTFLYEPTIEHLANIIGNISCDE